MYTFIDPFAGSGALAYGLVQAGFQPLALLDKDKHCVDTLKKNFKNCNALIWQTDSRKFTYPKFPTDVLVADLPQQDSVKIKTNDVWYFLKTLVRYNMPRVILFVLPATFTQSDKWDTLLDEYVKDGYTIKYKQLRARDFSVAHQHVKTYVIATKDRISYNFPIPSSPFTSVRLYEALKDVPESVGDRYINSKAALFNKVPSGGNWTDLPWRDQLTVVGKAVYRKASDSGRLRRLSWSKICPPLPVSPNSRIQEVCHPEKTRPLTVREYARVQSFPDSYQFGGSILSQYKQIAQAIPVNIALALGSSIYDALRAYDKTYRDRDQ